MGAFMQNNIDELPQFLMHCGNYVCWPRPHMLMHTEQYSELINNYLVRHYAKPELWLGAGKRFRGETKELIEMKDRVDYIWYIETGVFIDIKNYSYTVYTCFKGEEKALVLVVSNQFQYQWSVFSFSNQ
jgi:undecaprenyl-phosphate galactose phosphotransferase/putative colanic acid biosynthesis UDP-glucose lipid carrier transferase